MDRLRPVADGAPSEEGAPEAPEHQPDLAHPDLGELLRACGRGDETAFARLYDATSGRVVGVASDEFHQRDLLVNLLRQEWVTWSASGPSR